MPSCVSYSGPTFQIPSQCVPGRGVDQGNPVMVTVFNIVGSHCHQSSINCIFLLTVGYGRSASNRDDYLTDTVTDGDDEILESLVKTATRMPAPRERKRSNRPHTQTDRSARKYYYFFTINYYFFSCQKSRIFVSLSGFTL